MSPDIKSRAARRVGIVLEDKWTLERLLGCGGMAAVYAARHRNGARAAVKLLHEALAHDGDVEARFLREGYAANRVAHPGVVKVLDDGVIRGGELDGAAYLVMELLEGETLGERVAKTGTISEDDMLAIAEGLLGVLEAAHDHGVVHRDLKPDNVFVVNPTWGQHDELARRVRVLDFGIARLADLTGLTRVGAAIGTPSFMSPEQANGRISEIDGRSDLFAIGATMFRCLAGRRVHEGSSPTEVLFKMSKLPAPPLSFIAPFVSPATAAIVDRSLQFVRDHRYPNARAMLDDVVAARRGRPVTVQAPAAPTSAPVTAPASSLELPTSVDVSPPLFPAIAAQHVPPTSYPIPSPQGVPSTNVISGSPVGRSPSARQDVATPPQWSQPFPPTAASPQPLARKGISPLAIVAGVLAVALLAIGAFVLVTVTRSRGASTSTSSKTPSKGSDDGSAATEKDCERWGRHLRQVLSADAETRKIACAGYDTTAIDVRRDTIRQWVVQQSAGAVAECRDKAATYLDEDDDCFTTAESVSAMGKCKIDAGSSVATFADRVPAYRALYDCSN